MVGRHLNLYDAADEMSVTPSAMSHQIRLLEEDLGVELFVRKGRGLELTGRGAELLPLLSAIFSDLGSVISAFRRERGAGSVSVQMPASFATRWFLPNLASFEQAHPGVDVKLLSHDEPPLAPADGLDCAIRFGRSNWPAYAEYALYPEELVLVCSPRLLAGAERLQLGDIGRYRLLGVQHQPDVWKSWQQNFGIKPRTDARLLVFPTRELAIRGAVENLGLALAGIVEGGRRPAPRAARAGARRGQPVRGRHLFPGGAPSAPARPRCRGAVGMDPQGTRPPRGPQRQRLRPSLLAGERRQHAPHTSAS